ncbi:uncharacterized protein BX663DRAFT_555605 [Cokeromyces recurvatus]|uniref:uncharacterized protein n=1 Tax=Cokeromyces recurvatus TaxID=90255 RepID=UPI00221FEE0D|nr:uncharacterized protein BX663DRAFT_555605 [Cokeromyces recurvatus]KAI7898720.1 hypothetical protein BX663DRAFT_555605 [Cokeromyces recurvatus]
MSYYRYTIFSCKRFFTSKPWSYKEAFQWQQSFNRQQIPKEDISISFNRSSGPGGQNVNKVNTKVELRLSLSKKINWIPDYAIERLLKRTNKNGELIITSDKTRSQTKNIDDCYHKLVDMIKDSVSVSKEPDQATLQRIEQL